METKLSSNIHNAPEARISLMRGVSAVADAVRGTLGARSHNAILEVVEYPYSVITNDGVSIAERVKMSDPIEQIGRNLIVEAISRANKESGDGSTTTAVLTHAILEEGMKQDADPMTIKRSLDECLPIIFSSLEAQRKSITPLDVGKVAAISAEDEALGAILQEIYIKIGKDGIVDLDVSNIPETFYEIIDGVRLRNCGFMYPYMANDDKGRKAIYHNPKILITKQKIATLQEIGNIFTALSKKGITEIVIFCDEIDMAVSQSLAITQQQGKFNSLVIKAPTLWKDFLFEDFAKVTGATIIDPAQGKTLRNVALIDLGTCEKITTSKDETLVFGTADIAEHLSKLKEAGDDDSMRRYFWLQTKAAVLKVGANSESELSYRRLKAEDARNASYMALQEGVVAGGGVALRNCVLDLPDTVGGNILKVALRAPIRQIITNAGKQDPTGEFDDVLTAGFDAKTGTLTDMWEAGILDPFLVTKNAIKNAISVAGTVLTSKVIITLPQKHE